MKLGAIVWNAFIALAAPVGLAALVAFGAIMGIWAAQWAAHQLGYSN